MKQLLLLITLITITTTSFSQLNKNQFLVGGNASFATVKYGDLDSYGSKYSTLTLSPNGGYFILDKLAVGAAVGFTRYRSEIQYGNYFKFKNNSLSFSPFVRYYVLSKKYKVNLYGQVNYDYIKTNEKSYDESGLTGTYSDTENGVSFIAGPVFFINPYIALELTLSYATKKPKDDLRTSSFLTGLGFQIHLGKNKKAE